MQARICNGSDEPQCFKKTLHQNQLFIIQRLEKMEECRLTPNCDTSNCYEARSTDCKNSDCNLTDIICTLKDHCFENQCNNSKLSNKGFQCESGELILESQFCDGISHCLDESDEKRKQPGFKCSKGINACILPQRNLYDEVKHCTDGSDLCSESSDSCFECFDKLLLISSKQVCDGIIDCYDLSDECLCHSKIHHSLCVALLAFSNNSAGKNTTSISSNRRVISPWKFAFNPSLVLALRPNYSVNATNLFDETEQPPLDKQPPRPCWTESGKITPTQCDNRSECRSFRDECDSCTNPPPFCNDTCLTFYNFFYPLGDRYCDGVEDELAWDCINKTACPPGFDEKNCPERIPCIAGDKVSIDKLERCDGVKDCDDGSDESNCSSSSEPRVFASDTEMIENKLVKSVIWITGIIIVFSNAAAIVTKIKFLQNTNLSNSLRCQHLIILNIAFADLLMGIYLLTVAVFSVIYSGEYHLVKNGWQSSLRCSIIGSLTIISSESSCFLMVALTAFRLFGIQRPFLAESFPNWPWKLCIGAIWLVSLTLGILPIFYHAIPYFVYRISLNATFSESLDWNKKHVTDFASRFAIMANKTVSNVNGDWGTTLQFLDDNFHEQLTVLGYYCKNSLCMPRFYVEMGESSWEYSLAIITINFLCFLFIAVGYFCILIESNKISKKEAILQRRIARIIATDMCCWIPICILAYAKAGGARFPRFVYQFTGVFILPINSAINPFLYSSLTEKIKNKIFDNKKLNAAEAK